MGALLSLPVTLLNLLLPFTNASTPLYQDLVHTAILCGTLYFAPQIAEWYNAQQTTNNTTPHDPLGTSEDAQLDTDQATANLPLEERLLLQDDSEEALPNPPPLAPTPPPTHHQPHIAAENLPPAAAAAAFEGNDNNDDAGPAHLPRATPANRTVGAKKAKSLARKDQRRAYHEFHRQEAELRRLQDAEGAEEREAVLAAERERRARREEEIREREREERERVKREREDEAEEERGRRERVVSSAGEAVRMRGAVDLVVEAWKEGKDRVWAERVVRASGVLGELQREGGHVMVTEGGWLVRLDKDFMTKVYEDAENHGDKNSGKVSFVEFGTLLEKAVLARAEA